MNKEELAALLNGREYGDEITGVEAKRAKDAGLVVLVGGSDDLACFYGALSDEAGCAGGGEIYLHRDGLLGYHDPHCDCAFCGFDAAKVQCATIKAIWDAKGYSWVYETAIPHACFDIMEDDGKYCRGIVFNVADLPELKK